MVGGSRSCFVVDGSYFQTKVDTERNLSQERVSTARGHEPALPAMAETQPSPIVRSCMCRPVFRSELVDCCSPPAAQRYVDCTCNLNWINDNYCDGSCNNAECLWDGGDCPIPSPTPVPTPFAYRAKMVLTPSENN